MSEPIPDVPDVAPAPRIELPRLAATLTLLLTQHPALADYRALVRLREGQIEFEIDHGDPIGAAFAAELATALQAKHGHSDGARQDGRPFVHHWVYGEVAGVPVNFYCYVYPRAAAGLVVSE